MTEHHYSSISEIGQLIRQRQLLPVDVVKSCLQRIEALNPVLNAFITVTGEQALREAQQAQEELRNGLWRGPLHGVPVGVKDMFDTAGVRTTAAFEPFRDRVPSADAEAVTRLREAGAVLVGKTNLHELAQGTTSVVSYFGAVRNPWDPAYVAGGSSGGSAAAVAAGLCYATLDTDAIGSCRLPASCCGVTGFKATNGLLSTAGILEGEPADDVILKIAHTAFTCRTVEDAAVLLSVLGGPDAQKDQARGGYDVTVGAVEAGRIGVVRNFRATDEVKTAFIEAVNVFRSLPYATTEVDAPLEFSALDLANIEADRAAISGRLFAEVDVLILPTTTDQTPTIEDAREAGPQAVSADNTFFGNYYGLPAISVPCGFDSKGLPLGLQIVGPRGGEELVLSAARRFQQATDWHRSHPSV